jgi:hypothetical protein
LSDEQQIASLEKKIDLGFAETREQIVASERALRGEARADFRTLIAVVVAMWTATVLAIVGVLLAHL